MWCDSGANIHSCREDIVDLSDWGIEDAEWEAMTDEEKDKIVMDWAYDKLDIGWSEI